MSFSVREALREEGELLVLQTPRAFWVKRGLVLALLVPGLLVVLIGLFALLEVLLGGTPGLLTGGVAVISVLVGGPCLLVGGLHVVRAGPRSAASRVEIDLAAGEIRPTDGPATPLSAVLELRLNQARALHKWHRIVAHTGSAPQGADGPYKPPRGGREVVLLGNLNELELGGARDLLRRLGARLDRPVHDHSSSLLGGLGKGGVGLRTSGGHAFHAAAYLPFQGIFLLASVALLIFKRDDPAAAFHAKQSLSFIALETAVMLAFVFLAVGLMLLVDQVVPNTSGEPHPVALVGAVLLVVPVTLGRIGLRLYATRKAWRGECWVIPGFGWVSRRWLPPADYQA